MANVQDALLTGALLAGGGFAGYLGGRWLIRRYQRGRRFPLRNPRTPRSRPRCGEQVSERGGAENSGDARSEAAPGNLGIGPAAPLRLDLRTAPRRHPNRVPARARHERIRDAGGVAVRSGPGSLADHRGRPPRLQPGRGHRAISALTCSTLPSTSRWAPGSCAASSTATNGIIRTPRTSEPTGTTRDSSSSLTFGWNAGWSEAGGVGRVARYLESSGQTDITIDLIHLYARAAGASRHLSRADKVAWSKKVAALYQTERRASATPSAPGS